MSMLTKAVPKSGESLPVIGLGSYQTFDVGSRPADRTGPREVISKFVQGGGRVIDSSPMYGRAESVIGDSLAEAGIDASVFTATKVWTSGRESGVRQMTDSMRKLRTQRIDLMQVHNLLDVETHLETLREWKSAGRIRYIGVTHYTGGAHSAVARVMQRHELDFVQINYSLLEREAERTLLPLAAERGIAVIVNRPFAGGELLKRLHRTPLPAEAAELRCTSWAQLALKFIVAHPAVTCVIPATSTPEHLLDFIEGGAGPLPDALLRERIAAAMA